MTNVVLFVLSIWFVFISLLPILLVNSVFAQSDMSAAESFNDKNNDTIKDINTIEPGTLQDCYGNNKAWVLKYNKIVSQSAIN
jgi:hypothetical protein